MAKDKDSSSRLFDKLLEQRTVMLNEPVMPKAAQRLVAQLLYLDAQDSKKPIHFYINTPGGSISDGFAIFDAVRFINAPVTTLCTGLSASMGTILMLAPPKAKKDRVCLPNTRFMIHQPSGGLSAAPPPISRSARRKSCKTRDRLIEIYVEETNMDADRIRTDLHRDFWMDAQGAVDYGLCDRVVTRASDLD